MARAYQPRRHSLKPQSTVDMAQLLAAREDICNVVKTSSGSSTEKTSCAVNKVQKNGSFLSTKCHSFDVSQPFLCPLVRRF